MAQETPRDREQARDGAFVELFLEHERRIFAFILSLVPDWHNARDVLQETSKKLWEKFGDFEPGTDFAAWALAVARIEVLRHRRDHARAKVRFSEATVEALARERAERTRVDDVRLAALARCVSSLSPEERELIRARYAHGATTQSAAEVLGRSVNAVYKRLGRIHRALLVCVRSRLARELG